MGKTTEPLTGRDRQGMDTRVLQEEIRRLGGLEQESRQSVVKLTDLLQRALDEYQAIRLALEEAGEELSKRHG